jgi:hypothetical protein
VGRGTKPTIHLKKGINKMSAITINHIKGRDLPHSWLKTTPIDPEATFKITLEAENEIYLTKAQRNHWIDVLEQFSGNENSEKWIHEIKSARTCSELKTPLI